jgi:hypothetical protein
VQDSIEAAVLAYDSLLVKLTPANPASPDVPKPREISPETVDKMQSYLSNTPDNREEN